MRFIYNIVKLYKNMPLKIIKNVQKIIKKNKLIVSLAVIIIGLSLYLVYRPDRPDKPIKKQRLAIGYGCSGNDTKLIYRKHESGTSSYRLGIEYSNSCFVWSQELFTGNPNGKCFTLLEYTPPHDHDGYPYTQHCHANIDKTYKAYDIFNSFPLYNPFSNKHIYRNPKSKTFLDCICQTQIEIVKEPVDNSCQDVQCCADETSNCNDYQSCISNLDECTDSNCCIMRQDKCYDADICHNNTCIADYTNCCSSLPGGIC